MEGARAPIMGISWSKVRFRRGQASHGAAGLAHKMFRGSGSKDMQDTLYTVFHAYSH